MTMAGRSRSPERPMTHDTLDPTLAQTLSSDEEASQEGVERPLSSTINPSPEHGGGFSIWKTSNLDGSCEPRPGADLRNCDRRLVHKRSSTIRKSPSPSTDLGGSDWRRSVVHNPRVRSRTHTAGSSASPSSRSSRNVPGLIVRGRVFYLRLRVPRTLQQKVGRTHALFSAFPNLSQKLPLRRIEASRVGLR